ncbi:MAG TPA: fibronectin type III domain-containing protein [Acidimicrobiales bacterium]|nr:fibronectin type III domain-containing protein [Acidimicrobiales bacterium]
MSKRKVLLGGVIGATVLSLGATSAWAYLLLTSATVTQSVTSSSVGAPTSPRVLLYNGTAILSWTAPSSPSGATFTYTVSRGASQGAAGGTCSGTISSTTCTDTGLTAGSSYSWTISSTLTSTNWSSVTNASAGPVTAVGALTQFVWSATPAGNVTAGSALSGTVTAEDASGRTETGYTGSIAFSSTDGQALFPSPNSYTFTASDAGQHAFSNTFTLMTSGSQTLSATDSGLGVSGTSPGIAVVAAAASQIVAVSGSGQAAAIGTNFASPLVAAVEDQYGNGVSGQSVAFTAPAQAGASAEFLNSSGTCDGSGTAASTCAATTGSTGQVSVTAVANATIGGPYSATATWGTASTIFSLTNSAAATTTSLVASYNPVGVNVTVTYTASVTGSGGTPTGTVSFKDGGVAINGCGTSGVVNIVGGKATCQVSYSTTAGSPHSISGSYSGDSTFSSSSGSLNEAVQADSNTFSFTSSGVTITHVTGLTYTAAYSGGASDGDQVTVYVCDGGSGTAPSTCGPNSVGVVMATATPVGGSWQTATISDTNNHHYRATAVQTDALGKQFSISVTYTG